jgi:hypothetical protein
VLFHENPRELAHLLVLVLIEDGAIGHGASVVRAHVLEQEDQLIAA